jgi:hypothetical protein
MIHKPDCVEPKLGYCKVHERVFCACESGGEMRCPRCWTSPFKDEWAMSESEVKRWQEEKSHDAGTE